MQKFVEVKPSTCASNSEHASADMYSSRCLLFQSQIFQINSSNSLECKFKNKSFFFWKKFYYLNRTQTFARHCTSISISILKIHWWSIGNRQFLWQMILRHAFEPWMSQVLLATGIDIAAGAAAPTAVVVVAVTAKPIQVNLVNHFGAIANTTRNDRHNVHITATGTRNFSSIQTQIISK